jgi:tetratricopeptide (TPR) repeat protein
VIPYIEELLKLEQDTDSNFQYSSFLGPEQRRQQIFLAIRDFLEAAAYRKPLLLILEDLHWADDASLGLLTFLSTAILESPLIVYATTRSTQSERTKPTFEQLRKALQDQFWEISLENLSFSDSQKLFQELLASSEFPMAIDRKVLLQAEGNPFYLEEIIRMLMDQKILQEQNGRWVILTDPGFEEIGVPETVQDLIQARFDRLSAVQKKVLQVASLIGRQFEFQILAAVLQSIEEEDLSGILSSLVKKSFLTCESKECKGKFSFQHVLTSDTIYQTLVRREKEEWHGRIGETLERMLGIRVQDHVEILASHYLRSNRFERALHFSILAGKKAARDYATEQATWYFEEARRLFDLSPHNPRQVEEVCLGLGDVAMFTGDYSKARDYYEKVLQMGNDSQFSSGVWISPVIKMKIGATYTRQGDFDLALSTLWDAINLFSEPGSIQQQIEKAQILDEIGWVNFLKGNVQEARDSFLRGLHLVQSTDQFDVLASIYNRLGAVAYQSRAYQEASEYVRRSLELREKIGDLAGVARLHNNLGLLGLVQGYLREAEENFLKSYEILKKLGDAEGIALTAINAGLMKCERGEFQPAAEFLKRGFQAASQIGHRFYIGLARMYMGRLQSMLGDYDSADTTLQESIQIFNEIGAMDNIIDATIYLGENNLLRDKVDAALASAKTVYSLISIDQNKSSLPSVQYGRVIRLRGVIHRYKGEFEPASKLIRASTKVFEESNEQLELARSIFELGRLAEMGGNSRAAREYFCRARTLFSLLGADLDLSRLNQISRPG